MRPWIRRIENLRKAMFLVLEGLEPWALGPGPWPSAPDPCPEPEPGLWGIHAIERLRHRKTELLNFATEHKTLELDIRLCYLNMRLCQLD